MSTDLESVIREAAKSGKLNHVSVGFMNNEWSASYRGVENRDGRIVGHPDPVHALIAAITGKKPPEPEKPEKPKRASKPKPLTEVAPAPVTSPDDEDLLV